MMNNNPDYHAESRQHKKGQEFVAVIAQRYADVTKYLDNASLKSRLFSHSL